jgi:hypothetical protein
MAEGSSSPGAGGWGNKLKGMFQRWTSSKALRPVDETEPAQVPTSMELEGYGTTAKLTGIYFLFYFFVQVLLVSTALSAPTRSLNIIVSIQNHPYFFFFFRFDCQNERICRESHFYHELRRRASRLTFPNPQISHSDSKKEYQSIISSLL